MAMGVRTSARSSLRAPAPKVAKASRQALACRADAAFLGSPTNIIMVASTGLCLAAARFGRAPTVRLQANTSLKLEDKGDKGIMSNDPSGFTAVDVFAMGAAGHGIGVGIVLGLKGIGAI